jgi:hypothetical protein
MVSNPKCKECAKCEECEKEYYNYTIDNFSNLNIQNFASLNRIYTISINDKKLTCTFGDTVNRRIHTLWEKELPSTGKNIVGKYGGQLTVLDENGKEIFAYPSQPIFSEHPYPLCMYYITNDGVLTATHPFTNQIYLSKSLKEM